LCADLPQSLDELLSSLLSGPDDPPPLATTTLAEEEADDDQQQQQQQQQHSSAGTPNGDVTAAGLNGSSGSTSESGVASGVQRVLAAADGQAKMQFMQQQQQQQQQQQGQQQGARQTQPGNQQQQQQQADQQPLVKVVLARRTAIPWEDTAAGGGSAPAPQPQQQHQQQQQQLQPGWQRRSGAVLLQALQERDPRAYQLLLSTPPGSTFIACTPERLYVRSGRLVASEAVAGTRPRGPPGDLEADFYQGLDLLQSPKDHAEFTLVRDWIRQQLAPLCVELKTGMRGSSIVTASSSRCCHRCVV
jgi:isochorismate synthase EntC